MTYEGIRDWFGRECKPLVNFRSNKWEFAGLDVPGLEGFEIDIGSISQESKNLQEISDLVSTLDNLQFRDCQRRKKWHERLKQEQDHQIRLEITRRLLDAEDKTYDAILEIVRLLKGTKTIVEDTNESNTADAQLKELVSGL